jgi:hypothetical protein
MNPTQYPMQYVSVTAIVLAAISVVGAMAIPYGDPKFIDRAIILELSFIALTILVFKGYKKALFFCIPLAVAVIIGNSLAPPHVKIMTTFSKPFNAVLLIIGGYILQATLIGTSFYELAKASKHDILQSQRS